MKSPQVFRKGNFNFKNGFSLIEILIVLGVMTLILSFGLSLNFDSLNSSRFISEEKMFLGFLRISRSRALNNLGNSPHGLFVDDNSFILFQGDSLEDDTESHEIFSRNKSISIEKDNVSEFSIVFEKLTAEVLEESEIKISDNRTENIININSEGRIDG